MSTKGGYKIIDLLAKEIDTDGTAKINVPNVYEAIEGNLYKPLLISGLNLDGTVRTDFFSEAEVSSDDFVIKFDITVVAPSTTATGSVGYKKLTIDDDDDITYSVVSATLPKLEE